MGPEEALLLELDYQVEAAVVVGTIPLPVLLAVLVIPQHQHLHLIQMHSKVIQAEQAQ